MRKMKQTVGTAVIVTALALGSNAWAADGAAGPKIVAYLRTWPLGSTQADMDVGKRWSASTVKADNLTDLVIAFGLIRNGTEIYIKDLEPQPKSTDPSATIAPFSGLKKEITALKKKYPALRVNFSVGGWGADGFSDVASDPKMRAAFVANFMAKVREFGFDGIDIDWEYPVGPDWGLPIKTRPEDKDNYLTLLRDLRSALDAEGAKTGKRYGLSVAVPASTWFIQKIDTVALAGIVDALKVMCYDYYGSWSATTGHHANLYNNPADPAWGGWSSDQAIRAYLDAGVPPAKLLLGVGFYGRAWKGVPPENGGLYQKHQGGMFEDGLSWPDIKKLAAQGSYKRGWDDVAKSPYLYNGDIWITYTDEEEIKAIGAYAKEKMLGGVMVWEYAHDPDGELLSVLAKAVR